MINELCTDYVLVAEEPAGNIILCKEYCEKDYEKAVVAFNALKTARVILYKQECNTHVLFEYEEGRYSKRPS